MQVWVKVEMRESGCGIKQSMDDTDAKISVFHADLDNARFGEIWNQTSPTLRKAASEKEFVAMLEAVNNKLGKVESSKQAGWRINSTPQGTFVSIGRETKFEKGLARC